MSFSISGIHVPHMKNTANHVPERPVPPKNVVLPVVMHIGKPAVPKVKKGDYVKVGELIAEQDGAVSSPVYASVSGTVIKTEDILLSSGTFAPAIYIESDGLMSVYENIAPPVINERADFIKAIKDSGVVGLGGAGFPTYIKLDVKREIEELIINGAECEPYITSDTRTMIDDAEEIVYGISLCEKFLGVKRTIIAIEENKKKAIEKMREAIKGKDNVSIKILKSMYPQGAEKVIVYNTTRKVIPAGKLPIDVGVVVCNCTTMAVIAKYIKTGMPLIEKCVTVDGSAVKEPKNLIVPIGTPIKYLLDLCGADEAEIKKVLYGGPMMGITVPNLDAPILKNTNAIIAMNEKEAKRPEPTQCIHCGLCAAHCPVSISPFSIARAYKKGDAEELKRLRVDICMECGCCSYVCPAKRPLVETNKLSKTVLREYNMKNKEEKK